MGDEEPDNAADVLALVERAKRQDRDAAEELVRRYQDKAYAVAYRTCSGDSEEAKDLTQEAFLRAFRSIEQFQGKASFYTWLYRIVVNTCLDGVRRQNRRRFFFPPSSPEGDDGRTDHLEGKPDPRSDSDPAANLSRRELKREVQRALDGLSSAQRMVFELKVFEEMSISEIARLTNSAEGTVKSHLFRATQHIRKALVGWTEK